jgi:hypothetical protein
MAVEPEERDFEDPDLRLSPEMHQLQAELAAERGEEYDPYEFEAEVRERVDEAPDPIEAAEPVE